ncbi:hypothetical protein AAVH_42852, partial [Aphelenchoides avenae]
CQPRQRISHDVGAASGQVSSSRRDDVRGRSVAWRLYERAEREGSLTLGISKATGKTRLGGHGEDLVLTALRRNDDKVAENWRRILS